MQFGWLGRVGRELLRRGHNEAGVARSVRPKDKRCDNKNKESLKIVVSASFMNNLGNLLGV